MKNITISIDDETYRRARIRAAGESTSVSAVVKKFLVGFIGGGKETEFQQLQREEQELRAELRERRMSLNPAHNLTRDELHERDAIR